MVNVVGRSMRAARGVALFVAFLLGVAAPSGAAGIDIAGILPVPACAEGWAMDGKVVLYDRENLFDRIDGEAELYFPFGFEVLASARYANPEKPGQAVEADVYRMGSLLDAFGLYANYRRRDDAEVKVGAGGTSSSSQLFFYQDRYFVRIQATGTNSLPRETFLTCARALSRNLPAGAGPPRELEAFKLPAVEPGSERYVAQSLLGYDFFRRGVIANAVLQGEPLQLFLVPGDSREGARGSFEQYRTYLQASGKKVQVTEQTDRVSLSGVDPLYGNIYLEQSGRFIFGAVRFTDLPAARKLVEQLRKKAGA